MAKVLKIDGYGRTTAGTIGFNKHEYFIADDGSPTGAVSFGTIDNIYGVLAFVNGIEVNITYDAYASVINTVDILADTDSVGYPSLINLYWNGSQFNGGGETMSSLGDLEGNDIVRIYSVDI